MFCPLSLALVLFAQPDLGLPAGPIEPARVEHFVLEDHAPEGARPVAVVALRRVQVGAGLLLEQELVFRESGLRILIDEHHDLPGEARSPRLVWRELRSSPGTGRTWLAEWDPIVGDVVTANHGTRSPVHGSLPGAEPLFPLALIEALRAGEPLTSVETLDPLGRARVKLEVHSSSDGERRAVELRRQDGSLAARYVFLRGALMELKFQAGRRVGRPCDRAEFERLSGRWKVRFEPLEDLRALARRPRARPR